MPAQGLALRPHEQRHLPVSGGDYRLAATQLRPRFGQIALQPVLRLLAQRHQPLLAALAGHPQHALAQVDRVGRQVDQLAHAQASGVHQFQHGAVTQARRGVDVRCAQQCFDLAFRQGLRQRARQLGGFQQCRRVIGTFATLEALREKRTQRRQQTCIAARRPAVPGAPRQVIKQTCAIDPGQATASTVAPARQSFQIAPIAVQRRTRQALLGPDDIQKPLDGTFIRVTQRRQLLHQLATFGGSAGSGHRRQG
ncbi:hypothetical protein D3C71_1288690 [compost metagenome]